MKTPKLYGYPEMGRYGLGHSLMAWARCAVWCRDAGATMLAPRWLRPRIGPYIRRERDKRAYFLYFGNEGYVKEPMRSIRLLTSEKIDAAKNLPAPGFRPDRPTVVIFENLMSDNERTYLPGIYGNGAFLHKEMLRMTRPRFRPARPPEPFLAVHVRMGDFSVGTREQLLAGATNCRIPVEWFAAAVEQFRKQSGRITPVTVFSDGPDEALTPLLQLPLVKRSPPQPAITDMLSIAQASGLVASGSGFSLWGAIFGDVPRIFFPGQKNVSTSGGEPREFDWLEDRDIPTAFFDLYNRPRTSD